MHHGVTRTDSETTFSRIKESKRQKNLNSVEAESVLDSAELKAMLTDQRNLLSAMGDFVSDLMDLKTAKTDPRKLLKMLLLEPETLNEDCYCRNWSIRCNCCGPDASLDTKICQIN
jgi:hypothetical protein